MANFEDRYGSTSSSDSGVFLLDPEDRALLRACADACTREEKEAEAHRRFLKLARELPAVRLQKVMAIRRMIASGDYVTEEKLQATVDRLLSALGR